MILLLVIYNVIDIQHAVSRIFNGFLLVKYLLVDSSRHFFLNYKNRLQRRMNLFEYKSSGAENWFVTLLEYAYQHESLTSRSRSRSPHYLMPSINTIWDINCPHDMTLRGIKPNIIDDCLHTFACPIYHTAWAKKFKQKIDNKYDW